MDPSSGKVKLCVEDWSNRLEGRINGDKGKFCCRFCQFICLVQDMSTRFCSKVPIGIAFSELCAQLSDCRRTELLDVCLAITSLLSFSLQILRPGELRLRASVLENRKAHRPRVHRHLSQTRLWG